MPNEGLRVAASDPDHRAREPDLAWTMSALPPKADMARRHRYVRFVPIVDLSRCSKLSDLLDHLVGAGEQRRRDIEAERSGGLMVEDQFEFRGLHDRQVTWFLAFEHPPSIDTGLALAFPYA